ncbi:ABC-type dipeptide/oligopeptide/nickel transport system ATPase component/ABC-type dipeptide/oligopeptide/nickel transport system permease subunit [Pseudarthrobacter sp. PvP004]|nr:dipeptide/oligopeptide/nickel ABC transporter permease/ATP-binding protein [Pseudarthrobacter sp. PvP004]MBP2266181.1 ABC-type dipeptide/oligopeptide/nickel transport system ATPase component/ABC-type dipeptide/oligopeptide/nickel transport system permease subunit [Pseudarthrobacter sp. PvP004]
MSAVAILLMITLLSVAAGLITQMSPSDADINAIMQAPSSMHPLGTDSAGRDVFSRLLHGGQQTLLAALLATGVALALGIPTGLVAGYYGKWPDTLGIWGSSLLLSLPAIVVLLAVRASFGPSVWISMTTYGVLTSASIFRVTRGSVRNVVGELYVDAARVSGLSDARIIARHILSAVRAPIIIQSALISGIAIGVQAGLEFLGLGDPTVATWGLMLSEGFRNIYVSPWLAVWPALAVSLTILCLVYLGGSVRDSVEETAGPDPQSARAVVAAPASRNRKPVTTSVLGAERLLVVEGLTIAYPQEDGSFKRVVNGVSFELGPGETLGIVGESGSGKSQIAFSVLDLLPDSARRVAGEVTFNADFLSSPGRNNGGKACPAYGRDVAYIPQEPMSNLDPSFTIGHQLVRPMVKVMGLSRSEARDRAISLLTRVGIRDPQRTLASYPHEISGGMAQRVLIAGAVSCSPRLLIADEPTTALDVTVQAEVLDLLKELQAELGMGLLLVTHNFGVVADMCERVLVMEQGTALEIGNTAEVLSAPNHPYTRLLLSSMLEGREPFTPIIGSEKAGVPR